MWLSEVLKDSQTKTLIKNIAAEKWREVSNAVLRREELAPDLKKGINKRLQVLEIGRYVEARNRDELAGFSNKLFMEKSEFTVWFQCTLGACRLSQEDLSKEWSRRKFPCLSDGNDYSRTERERVCRALQDVNNNVSQWCKTWLDSFESFGCMHVPRCDWNAFARRPPRTY